MFMNRDDIDEAHEALSRREPSIAPYSAFLKDWRDAVDDNSDGWPYWKQGSKCADRLMRLVSQALDVVEGRKPRDDMPPEAMFRAALVPIRQMATRKGLPQPDLAEPAPAGAPGMR